MVVALYIWLNAKLTCLLDEGKLPLGLSEIRDPESHTHNVIGMQSGLLVQWQLWELVSGTHYPLTFQLRLFCWFSFNLNILLEGTNVFFSSMKWTGSSISLEV